VKLQPISNALDDSGDFCLGLCFVPVGCKSSAVKVYRVFGLAMVLLAGCSRGPGAIRPPDIDAEDAAQAAIELHDGDGDGQLSKEELSKSPALQSVAAQYDTGHDGALSADEIGAGIDTWKRTGVGVRFVPFAVQWNGRPLAGATVRLVPAPFLGDIIKPATGETNQGGGGRLDMPAEDRPKNAPNIPLMHPGLYQVEITHPSVKIPAKYNTETTLGIEITGTFPGPEGVVWSLSAK
jgi:hypothetical protein